MVPPPLLLVHLRHKSDDGLKKVHHFWAFGNKIGVFLVEDHLVMRWGRKKNRVSEYFRILVLSEGAMFTDEQVKKGLRRRFFGSADFIQQMHDTHCCPE